MNLLNWKKNVPTKEGESNPFWGLQHEFAKTINSFNKLLQAPDLSSHGFENLMINPSIDVVEDNTTFKVEVEMPGVGEENIHVFLDEGMLVIKGEKSVSRKDQDKSKNYIAREIGYGSYMRSIALPEYVDTAKASASFKKGMLWVVFPKKSQQSSSKTPHELKITKVQ